MEAWEIEFSPQDVFPLMLFAIFSVKISIFTTGSVPFDVRSHVEFSYLKFSTQEVFPLMHSTMWSRGKLLFIPREVFLLTLKAMFGV